MAKATKPKKKCPAGTHKRKGRCIKNKTTAAGRRCAPCKPCVEDVRASREHFGPTKSQRAKEAAKEHFGVNGARRRRRRRR